MYYDLVRFLIYATVDLVNELMGDHHNSQITVLGVAVAESYPASIGGLEDLKLKWLSEPHADLDGYIPFEVI